MVDCTKVGSIKRRLTVANYRVHTTVVHRVWYISGRLPEHLAWNKLYIELTHNSATVQDIRWSYNHGYDHIIYLDIYVCIKRLSSNGYCVPISIYIYIYLYTLRLSQDVV